MHKIIRDIMLSTESVNNLLFGRVYWADAPTDSHYPLALLTQVSGSRYVALDGDIKLPEYRVQIDVYSKEHRDIRSTQKALTELWSGYRSSKLTGVFMEGAREITEKDDGEHGVLYRFTMDIVFRLQENKNE